MADGRHKPIEELEVGDAIYGTERDGEHRRYVRTTVLDKWITVKPAFRVVLEDGTELVASGDHRFLTNRGWKHVRNSPRGDADRPHLTGRVAWWAQVASPGSPQRTRSTGGGIYAESFAGTATSARTPTCAPGETETSTTASGWR